MRAGTYGREASRLRNDEPFESRGLHVFAQGGFLLKGGYALGKALKKLLARHGSDGGMETSRFQGPGR